MCIQGSMSLFHYVAKPALVIKNGQFSGNRDALIYLQLHKKITEKKKIFQFNTIFYFYLQLKSCKFNNRTFTQLRDFTRNK